MTVLTRAASVAAALFTFAGFGLFSTASVAAELPAMPLTAPMVQPATPSPVPVPQATPAVATTATPTALDADASSTPAIAPDATDDDVVAYPTLAAAVAAQDVASASDEDLRCLAGAIYYEARGEPLAGQLAVAEVILNRVDSGRFARSVCGVVTQPAQFSFVRGGRMPAPVANADYRTALAVAKVAMKEAWESGAARALYFHARRVSPGWSRARVAAIGNHVFYR